MKMFFERRPGMGQKVYVASSLLWGTPLDELMQTVHECGFSGVEMWAQQFFDCGYDAA